jgi:penicillin-binding protein 2
MQQEEVELTLPAFDAGTGDANFSTITVPRFPGLDVEDAGAREYPFESITVELDKSTFPSPLRSGEKQIVRVDGVACHILGRMRDMVYEDDIAARRAFLAANPAYAQRACLNLEAQKEDNRGDRGSYRKRDRVGAAGIEYTQEHMLRGLRGVQSRRLDTGAEGSVAPEDGKDLHLSLDIALQAKIQAIMAPEVGLAKVQEWQGAHSPTQHPGDALYGAAVVLDIDSGELIALVSTPTFTREQLATDPKSIYSDDDPDTIVSMPGVNKAIAKAYVPGSIVKAMMLAEAETRGTIPLGHAIDCTGHLFPDRKDAFRCWIYKMTQASGSPTTHNDQLSHAPSGPEALMVSCNIYFFTLGKLLGVDGILSVYKDFGVGTRYDLGLGYEHAGQAGRRAPPPKLIAGAARKPTTAPGILMNSFDAIQMGIGQGPVTWTPVHAADAYATLARGGVRVPPRLIRNGPRGDPVDLHLKPDAVAEALEGLKLSVNDSRGTGNHINFEAVRENTFNVQGVTIWGKTGTATASPIKYDPDGEGPMPIETLEEGDHSWFVVLVGNQRPQYAISVVIDFGGSGGKVSGPIVNQIIHALDAEGYLSSKDPAPRTN